MMKKLLAPILGLLLALVYTNPAMAQLIDPSRDTISNVANATGSSGSFIGLVIIIVNFALSFLGILAVIMVIYGGFLYVTSAGDEGAAGKGKQVILYAIIGIALILVSNALVTTVLTAGDGIAPA